MKWWLERVSFDIDPPETAQPWLLLTKEGCWKVVNEPKPNPAPANWTEKDEQALATIGLAVEDSQLIHISKAKTAAEAWKSLGNFHGLDHA